MLLCNVQHFNALGFLLIICLVERVQGRSPLSIWTPILHFKEAIFFRLVYSFYFGFREGVEFQRIRENFVALVLQTFVVVIDLDCRLTVAFVTWLKWLFILHDVYLFCYLVQQRLEQRWHSMYCIFRTDLIGLHGLIPIERVVYIRAFGYAPQQGIPCIA